MKAWGSPSLLLEVSSNLLSQICIPGPGGAVREQLCTQGSRHLGKICVYLLAMYPNHFVMFTTMYLIGNKLV